MGIAIFGLGGYGWVNPQIDPQELPATIGAIPVPEGYQRIEVDQGSFGSFLRSFPLNTIDNTVYLYTGEKKGNQRKHYAVLDIDVGKRDLQQCADAVMRLRGEYLYQSGQEAAIGFDFANGSTSRWLDYAQNDRSPEKFRKYMDYVFAYANTRSLHGQMQGLADLQNMEPGDVFVQTGNPYGHAMLVVDVAYNPTTRDKVFLLSQSYMPAQSIHIVRNLNEPGSSPWYSIHFGEELETPSWTFMAQDIRRF
ncbi:MAG: DUF4846 domain-containing protein [Salibacteraceae bacterium]